MRFLDLEKLFQRLDLMLRWQYHGLLRVVARQSNNIGVPCPGPTLTATVLFLCGPIYKLPTVFIPQVHPFQYNFPTLCGYDGASGNVTSSYFSSYYLLLALITSKVDLIGKIREFCV